MGGIHGKLLAEVGTDGSKVPTDVYYNAKDPLAEVYTHDTNLKKRLWKYAAQYPELCQLTEDDGQGGLRFETDKNRISIRLTAPYTVERRKAASELAKKRGIHNSKNQLLHGQLLMQEYFICESIVESIDDSVFLPPSLREVAKIFDFCRRECCTDRGTLPQSRLAAWQPPQRGGQGAVSTLD